MKEIENRRILEDIFGRWPSFHDAEIIQFRLDRSGVPDGSPFADLQIQFHLFEMTSEVDTAGVYILRKHTLVTIHFGQIDHLQMDGFNHQNVIFDFTIARPTDSGAPFHVDIDASYGCQASFDCTDIRVVQAQPWQNNPS